MAKMDLVSSPVLALKISKEDFDPDQCKFCGYGINVYIKSVLLRLAIFIVIYCLNT
jgi:hypothetical protein